MKFASFRRPAKAAAYRGIAGSQVSVCSPRAATRSGTNGGAIANRHGGRRQEEKQPADRPPHPCDVPGQPQVRRPARTREARVGVRSADLPPPTRWNGGRLLPPGEGSVRRIRRAGGAGAEAALGPRALKWRRVVVVVDSRTRCVLGVSAPRGATPSPSVSRTHRQLRTLLFGHRLRC